jgi:membrane-associated phospholipid phosphatase
MKIWIWLFVLVCTLAAVTCPIEAAWLSTELAQLPPDVAYVLTSPLRLENYDWRVVPVAAGALAVTMAYDGQIRDQLAGLREWGGAQNLEQAGNVVQFYGIALGTGFIAYGKAQNNGLLMDNGWIQWEGAATAGTIALIAKWVIGRARPDEGDPDYFKAFSGNDSFPSGHTTVAFTAAMITSEEYPSWWVRIPAFMAATAVGVSRIAADRHWAGDVLAGGLLGTGVGHAIFTVHRKASENWSLSSTGEGVTLTYAYE